MSVKEIRRVLLYGNSVILGSVGAGLRRSPQLEVTTWEARGRDLQAIEALEPDIVLFDLEATSPRRSSPCSSPVRPWC